jgi:hypothetical protein
MWINATTMKKKVKKRRIIKASLKFFFRQQSLKLSSLSSSSSSLSLSSLKKTNTKIAFIIEKISIICLFVLLNSLIRCRLWKKKIEKKYQNSTLKRIWKKNSCVSFALLLNFLYSRTFISIVNFVIRLWFFFCCLCLSLLRFLLFRRL